MMGFNESLRKTFDLLNYNLLQIQTQNDDKIKMIDIRFI